MVIDVLLEAINTLLSGQMAEVKHLTLQRVMSLERLWENNDYSIRGGNRYALKRIR